MPRSSSREFEAVRLAGSDAGEPHARFAHEVEIAVPLARVREALGSLEALSPLHPLIESIRALPADPARPAARRYRVVDQIPIGPFRMRSVYTAELEIEAEDRVRGEAWQSPGVHLVTIYALEALAPERTRLSETCAIHAPFGMRRFVAHQASRSHRETLAGLKRLLESESDSR